MDNEIMVSVSMITYNHGKYIRHALESVLMQETDFKFEIVIGDDCSSDNTQEIIREYEKKYPNIIKPIYRQENVGAINNSIDVKSKCKGKYLAILEGDDYFTSKYKLQKQVEFLETHKEYKSCAHRIEIVDENENHKLYTLSDLPLNYAFGTYEYSKWQTNMIHPNSLMLVNIFKENNEDIKKLFTTSKTSNHSMLLLTCLKMSDIYVFSESMTAWRCVIKPNATNYTSIAQENKLVYHEDKLRIYKAEKEYFQKYFKTINFSEILAKGYIDGIKIIKNKNSNNKEWKKCYKKYLTKKELYVYVPYVKIKIALKNFYCTCVSALRKIGVYDKMKKLLKKD